MNPSELIETFKREFERRKFVDGLLLAFIRFFRELGVLNAGYADLAALLMKYPQQNTTAQGKTANTLIVLREVEGVTHPLSIRPFYNQAEQFFRAECKRFDYPNCAPHATQVWRDYRDWMDALLGFTDAEVRELEQAVIDFVLDKLPSHEFDPQGLEPLERRFTRLLQGFDLKSRKGEPQGAVFQGLIYACVRADAPHLHLDVSKVGAGSKRLQRVGDIDGWEGERLVLSVEVKQFDLVRDDVSLLAAFNNEVVRRKAMGIIAALSFSDEARVDLEGTGLKTLDLEDTVKLVDLWDPLKQRAAVGAFTYYIHHIEKNKSLIDRLAEFFSSISGPPKG